MKAHHNVLLALALSAILAIAAPPLSPDGTLLTAQSAGSELDAYPPPITVGEATNLSTRGRLAGGDDAAMISGFVVHGGPVRVVARALGPGLVGRGVTGALEDPVLRINQGDTELSRNEDWLDGENAEELRSIGLAPADPRESAIVTTLEPGAYTGILQDQRGGSGIGLLEIFKAGGAGQLIELSTRGRVGSSEWALVGGFIPDEVMTVLITAIGPDLENQGQVGVLQDPMLRLYLGSRVIAQNDDWIDSPHADLLREDGIAPADPRESAIVITLSPWATGRYTAIMQGADGSGGIGMVKIRKLLE